MMFHPKRVPIAPALPARIVLLVLAAMAFPLMGIGEAIASGLPADAAKSAAVDPEAGEPYEELDNLFRLSQPYLRNLSPYQPSYFLFGTPLTHSKFQLSFKYRFFNPTAPLARKYPWVSGFHFAYTQTSFWDLKSDSKPFEDTSYKPEFFYLSRKIPWWPGVKNGFFLQGGVHHESNGQSGDASRSTNLVYLSPVLVFYNPDSRLGIAITPRLKYYYDKSEADNPNLPDYRGIFEVAVMVGKADGLVLGFTVRTAEKGTSIESDLTYPMGASWLESAQVYLHIQYVNALAENLLHYQERTKAFRIGFSFVR